MIEKTIFDYLSEHLKQPVYMELPESGDTEFFVLEKTGSGQANKIGSATVAVQSYAATLLRAAQLNEVVKEAMENAADLHEICAVRLNSDYNFTDTSTKKYRYQAVYNITHY